MRLSCPPAGGGLFDPEPYEITSGDFVGTGGSQTVTLPCSFSAKPNFAFIWRDDMKARTGNTLLAAFIALTTTNSDSNVILNTNGTGTGLYGNRHFTMGTVNASGVTITAPSNAMFENGITYHYILARCI